MVSKYYEYATWILGVIVIILVAVLVRAKNAPVDDSLQMAVENLQECNDELAAWRAENPAPIAADPAKQEELNNILKRCADATGAEQVDGDPDVGPEIDKGSLQQ